jgi:lysophospholipase L1-like esterase
MMRRAIIIFLITIFGVVSGFAATTNHFGEAYSGGISTGNYNDFRGMGRTWDYTLYDPFPAPSVSLNSTNCLTGQARTVTDTGGIGSLAQCGSTKYFSNIVFDGNSQTQGFGIASPANYYPTQVMSTLLSAGYFSDWYNGALSGRTTPQMQQGEGTTWQPNTAYAYYVYVLPTVPNGFAYLNTISGGGTSGSIEPTWPTTIGGNVSDNNITWHCTYLNLVLSQRVSSIYGTNNIVVGWEVRNDLSTGSTDVQAEANWTSWFNNIRSMGYNKIIVLTPLKASDLTGTKETYRENVQAWLVANSLGADAVVDIANTTVCPDLGNPSNTTYFQTDGIHLTAAGYTEVAGAVAPVLKSLLTPNPISGVFCAGGGTIGWGNPGFWEASVTRAAGTMLFFTGFALPSATTGEFFLTGLGSAQSSYPSTHCFSFVNTAANGNTICFNTSTTQVMGHLQNNVLYKLMLNLRATGCYYFIKGGTYTHWTPLYVYDSTTTATMYPSMAMVTGCTAGTQYFRQPIPTQVPQPILNDSFHGTRSGLGSSDGLGVPESGGAGCVWVQGGTAKWSIGSSTYAKCAPTLGATLNSGSLTIGQYYKIIATTTNHFYTSCAVGNYFKATAATALDASDTVQQVPFADIVAGYDFGKSNIYIKAYPLGLDANSQGGVDLCYDSITNPQSFVRIYYNGVDGKVHVDECLAGTWTNDLITPVTLSKSKLDIIKTGSTVYVTGAQGTYIGTFTVDPSITNNTKHGMFTTFENNNFSLYAAWDGGSAAQDTLFDQYVQ